MFKSLALTGVSVLSAAVLSTSAHADPGLDPHTPNGGALWCQGGLGNVALIPFCNGLPYPDGSYWHQEAASPFGIGGPASLPWKPPVLVKP